MLRTPENVWTYCPYLKEFDFLCGVLLGHLILSHSDNLSRTLQRNDMSAAESPIVAEITINIDETSILSVCPCDLQL